MPIGMKVAFGGIAVAMTASVAASFTVPKLVDPNQKLTRVAKHMAAGPTSLEDAKRSKKEFANAIKEFLKNNGQAKSGELSSGLEKRLPSSAYEVHVAELPRGLRVVEIDTVLQASDYLLMKTPAGMKVFDLPGFEVFDDARLVNDTAGPILTLIGHSGGPPPHHPIIRAYALLPDFINDETDKLVPPLKRDGRARFVDNGADIALELLQPASNTRAFGLLHWGNARYRLDLGANTAKAVEKQFAQAAIAAATPAEPAPTAPPQAAAPAVKQTGAVSTDQRSRRHRKPAKIIVRGLNDTPVTNALTDGQAAIPGAAAVAAQQSAPKAAQPLIAAMPSAEPADHGRHHNQQQPNAVAAPVAAASTAPAVMVAPRKAPAAPRQTASVKTEGATIRMKPARSSAVVTTISHGTVVQVLEQHNHWYRVRCNGQEGYVYGPLLAMGNAAQPAAPVAKVDHTEHKKHHKETHLVADISRHDATGATVHAAQVTPSEPHTSKSRKHHKHDKHEAVQEAPNLVP